jgi:BirA family biotin operon repressor/biotin-[acetyl-CoA-carboxylase] ligase
VIEGRKIAGTLIESEIGESGALALLIVGIGINLAVAPPETEMAATSLAALGRDAPVPGTMLEIVAARFDAWLQRWRTAGFAPIRTAWLAGAASLGRPIRVRLDDAELRGRFCAIDAQGSLLLDTPAGMRRISAGEVFPTLR